MPDLPERIVRMAERNLSADEDRLDRELEAEIATAKTGQWMAYSIAGGALLLALWMFLLGNTAAGIAFLSMPVVLFVRAVLPSSWFGSGDSG